MQISRLIKSRWVKRSMMLMLGGDVFGGSCIHFIKCFAPPAYIVLKGNDGLISGVQIIKLNLMRNNYIALLLSG